MADRATQIVNFYESTLASSLIGASGTGTTLSQAPTTDGASSISATLGDEDTWYYLVVAPDTAGSREVIVIKASSGTTITNVGRDIEGRYAATSLPEHTSGTIVRMAVVADHINDQNDRVATNITSLTTAVSDFNTNSASAITTFNSNGTTAINDINASSATSMVNNATDGTSIDVDIDNDYMLVYDATDSTSKKVYANQTNKELKGYKETDVAVTSSSGVVSIDLANGNTGSLTLTEDVTAFEFTNVPTNGVSSFTVKVTQDASTAYTVAINDIDINAPTLTAQTAKTAGAGGFDMTATLSAEDLLFFLFFDAGTPYLTATQEMS
jgi:hypothetical protein